MGLSVLLSMSGQRIVISLIVSAVLIVANGLFVAYEFALLASKKGSFSATGNRVSRAANRALSDLSMQLAGAQLAITVNSVALGYLAQPPLSALVSPLLSPFASDDVIGAISYGISLALVVLVQLVLGEMVPKNIALANPEKATRVLVIPYRAYLRLVRPLVRFLRASAVAGTRLFGIEPADEVSTARSAAELAAIVSDSSLEGAIEADSAYMLGLAINFAEEPISTVAVSLAEVASARLGSTAAQIERVATASGHTRIPISAPSPVGQMRFIGYVHVKDLIQLDSRTRSMPVPEALVRQMLVVEEDRPLVEVLRIMRRLRRHVGVVTDSNSNPVGIATIEDIIAALVSATESGNERL